MFIVCVLYIFRPLSGRHHGCTTDLSNVIGHRGVLDEV